MQALIVADDAAVRHVAEGVLARRGYRVTTRAAIGGEAAACRRDDDAFAVALIDADALGADLRDLCRCLRDRPGGDRRLILLVGDDDLRTNGVAAREAGADGSLPKPLDAVLLDARLAAADRPDGEASPPPFAVDDRSLVESVPVVPYVEQADDASTALYIGPQIDGLIGYRPEEWLARPGIWLTLLHPDDRDRVLAEHRRTNATGEPFRAEYRFLHPDGRTVWVRDEATLVRDESGCLRYRQGVVRDVTERKVAEEALHRREARFRALVRNAPDLITILAVDGTVVYESPPIERVLGYAPDELVGANALALVHPDDLPRVGDLFAQGLARPGVNIPVAFRFRHQDGSWRDLEAVGTNLLADPAVGGIVVNSRDVTEARRAEAALRASEERLRRALEGAAMGTWEWEIGTGRVRWSDRLGPLYGLPHGTTGITSEAFFALVHPDDRERVREADRRDIARGEDYAAEFRVVWPDGTVRWLEGKGRATIRDERGRATHFLGVTMDVTARKEAEAALRGSEQRYRDLFAAAERQARELALLDEVRTAIARELDLPTLFVSVVEAIARTFGYSLVSLYLVDGDRLRLQHQVGYHQVLDSIPLAQGVMGRVARTDRPVLIEDGRADPEFMTAFEGIVSEVCVPLHDEGRVVGVLNLESAGGERLGDADLRLALALSEHVGIAIGRARLYAAARDNETRFRSAFDHAPIGMALVGTDGRWLRVNRVLCAMLGYAETELLGKTFQDLTHPDDLTSDLEQVRRLLAGEADAFTMEKRYVHRRGHPLWVQLSVSLVRDDDGRPSYFISQIEDISGRRSLEDRLRHQALHDPLTGLPNRLLFGERLDRALARPVRRGRGVAVLFVDLDGFKLVNDTFGHEAGDRLLGAVGQRLAAHLGPADTIARFGGDEFAVLLEEATAAEAERIAERIVEAVRPPFAIDGRETFVGASVGIARSRGGRSGRTSARELLREADIALYRAKAAGRGTYALFKRRMMPSVVARLEDETALRRALDRGELRLHYQPEVALATEAMVGVEALVRWLDPRRGLVAPAGFVPLAEETGLIVPIGRWALADACRQARLWQERFPAVPLVVGVNLSARQFRRAALVDEVAAALVASGLDAHCLELEITESVLMDDADDSGRTLAALRRLGVRLAIDDFGTGYSSLAYLRRLAVDVLKIDQSFLRGLDADDGAIAILRAMTTLAHDLGMTVTAEGVETAAQLARLRELGVDHGQGFFFAHPLPAEGIDALLGGVAGPAAATAVQSPRMG